MTDPIPTGPPGPVADLDEYLADTYQEPTEATAEAFRVDTDERAAWAFRKRRQHQAELDRLRGLAAAERARIDAWERDATHGTIDRIAWLDGSLEGYYRELHAADPELPKSYRVPGGTIGRRKNPDTLEVACEAEAVEWLMDNCPELVRIAVDKAAAKKHLEGVGDATPGARLPVVEPSTGEIVPGLVHLVGVERVFVKPEDQA
jgi:hypothetical protein